MYLMYVQYQMAQDLKGKIGGTDQTEAVGGSRTYAGNLSAQLANE